MDCGLIFEEPRGSFAKDQGRLRSGLVLVDRIRWISIQRWKAARLSWRETARLGCAAPDTGEQLTARRWLGAGRAALGAAGGELGGGGVAGTGQNGHPGSFNSGFGTESERATSRTRWRDLRDAQRRRSARATAAGRSKAPASKIRAEQSEREGEKGSASVLSTSRSS